MRILTVQEAAALLRVSERSVFDALRRGRLPGRKIGKSWRIPEAALMEVLSRPAPALPAWEREQVGA